jgi:flagellar motor protein MotB
MAIQEAHAGDEAGEGENYFVSMTDMMVGVLFVFIIMLMAFALNFQQQTDRQEENINVAKEVAEKLDQLENQVRSRIDEIREAAALRSRLLRDLREALIAEGLVVEIDEANGVLRLTEAAVQFPSNGSSLDSTAKTNVGKIARVLARVLPTYSVCSEGQVSPCRRSTQSAVETVFIEGHTDQSGTDDRNWSLSTERAVNTYRELTAVSQDLRTLRNRRAEEILSVSGYSSTRQVDVDRSPTAYQKNRRIDLRFVMEVDSGAGLQEIRTLVDGMRQEIEKLRR